MRPRIFLARLMLGLSWLLQSLPVALLRLDDLIALNRRKYSRPQGTYGWDREDLVDAGLTDEEKALLEKIPIQNGRLLLLCVGVGREAIPLARRGFAVTGVDFVPEMVQQATRNAAKRGVAFQGKVQDISRLDVGVDTFDLAWLSAGMFSHIPTRARRVDTLRKIGVALKSGGYFLCEFHMDRAMTLSPKIERIRKIFAAIIMGNRGYEAGDLVGHFRNMEFLHLFLSADEIQTEFAAGGFEIVYFHFADSGGFGAAILKNANKEGGHG